MGNVKCDRELVFEGLLEKYDGLIRYASERMSIPCKLDADDQYVEGQLLLQEVMDSTLNGGVYAFTTCDCKDFEAVFKMGLWWRLTQKVNAYKAKCRDHRKESSPYLRTDEGDEITLWEYDVEICQMGSMFDMPGTALQFEETLTAIKSKLPENGKVLVGLLLDPTPMKSILEEYVKGRQRVPSKKIPLHIYRTYLGMKRFPFEDLMNLVKHVVVDVMSENGRDVDHLMAPAVTAPVEVVQLVSNEVS